MKLKQICDYLDQYLQLDLYARDPSQNGLQVEGLQEIHTIAVAVDARQQTFIEAAKIKAQLIIVHHGLFWGQSLLLNGSHYRRIKTLLSSDIALYAAHLPLDAHPEVGNNAVLAQALGLRKCQPWSKYQGYTIGIRGQLPRALALESFLQKVRELITPVGGTLQLFGSGPNKIRNIGIISGGAATDIISADRAGLDLLLTGETSHIAATVADELQTHLLCAGHYATETFGVKALAQHLREQFDINTTFIHLPTNT